MRTICCFLTLALAGVSAQERVNVAAQKEAMKKLSFLVGRWEGPATVTMGPGGPMQLRQTEEVQYKLDGLVLLVEGTGRDEKGQVVFNALATIVYDEATQAYRFRAYNGGRYLDTELRVFDKAFEWGYQTGPAKVLNRMTLKENGDWFEYTEVTLGSGPPRRTVEFQVTRK